jgi:hypothetical protein
MNPTIALGRRSLREAIRQPDALFMTMFIPIFFLVVNTGQAAEIFPSDSRAATSTSCARSRSPASRSCSAGWWRREPSAS